MNFLRKNRQGCTQDLRTKNGKIRSNGKKFSPKKVYKQIKVIQEEQREITSEFFY